MTALGSPDIYYHSSTNNSQIIDYVAVLRDNPPYNAHLLYPPMHLPHEPARLALGNLRLVDKAFNRSASRELFRGIRVQLDRGLSSISKLEALSSSDYAKHIRLIHFQSQHLEPWDLARNKENKEHTDDDDGEDDEHEDLDYEEDLDGESIKLPDEAVDRLSLVMANFRNLKAVDIWCDEFELPEKTMAFVPQIVTIIADLQFRGFIHKVTDLRAPVDGANHLKILLKHDDHKAAIRHFLRRIKLLDFISFIDMDGYLGLVDLDTIIKSSPNLLALTMLGDCTLVPLTTLNSRPRIRLESLDLSALEITSYHLLALLEECKESIKLISLDNLTLLSGTWLHFLFQAKKYANLITFFFMHSDPFLEGLRDEDEAFVDVFLFHAVGDVQRHTNANRIAVGLKPWTAKTYLHLSSAPLKDAVTKEYYEELCSQSWDAERP